MLPKKRAIKPRKVAAVHVAASFSGPEERAERRKSEDLALSSLC